MTQDQLSTFWEQKKIKVERTCQQGGGVKSGKRLFYDAFTVTVVSHFLYLFLTINSSSNKIWTQSVFLALTGALYVTMLHWSFTHTQLFSLSLSLMPKCHSSAVVLLDLESRLYQCNSHNSCISNKISPKIYTWKIFPSNASSAKKKQINKCNNSI